MHRVFTEYSQEHPQEYSQSIHRVFTYSQSIHRAFTEHSQEYAQEYSHSIRRVFARVFTRVTREFTKYSQSIQIVFA